MQENYVPGNVDRAIVARDFNVSPDALTQPFRHIVGVIERNGRKEFLKLATTPGIISRYTENEIEILQRRESGRYPLPVATPKLREKGLYDYNGQKLVWFTTDYIESEELYPLTPAMPANAAFFERELPTIVDSALALMDWQQDQPMPLDIPKHTVVPAVMDKIQGWIRERLSNPEMRKKAAKAYTLQESFFTNAEELASVLDSGPSHGDFVPSNFRITPDGQVYLMDMEHTKMTWFKFYDIAYMYHRLYTKYRNPQLARDFLQESIAKYSQRHTFDDRAVQNINIALAQRLIGGYFDAAVDGVTSWQLQNELSAKLLGAKGSLETFL